MTIAFIEWQSATMLWALAGIALPIVAHLLSRRGSQRIALPTARFLAMAQAQRGRRLRLSQWLLLLLRIAIVALIALAFARPGWREGIRDSAPDGSEELVIVLDASASMARATAAATPFAGAIRRAAEILDALNPASDRVGLVIAGVTNEPVLPRLTGNFHALRTALDALEPTLGSADLAEAVRLANRLPGARVDESGSKPAAVRRVILLTDAQAKHLDDLQGVANEIASCDLTIESFVGDDDADNLAITSLSIAPARPTRGRPFTVSATVANHGSRAATLEVQCNIEPAELAPRPTLVTILPDSLATVAFACEAAQADAMSMRVSIPADALEADNAMAATVSIRETTRVLILTAAPPQPRDAPSYLMAALHPDDESPYTVQRINASQASVDSVSWEHLDAVILCESGRLSLDWLTRIDQLVRGGGSLWWIVDSFDAAASTDVFASLETDVPALPLTIANLFPAPQPTAWGSADTLHQALASFDGSALGSLLGVRHDRFAQASAAPGAAVLIRGVDGSPIVAVRPIGRGRALVLNGSLSRDSTELTRSPLFPALVHEWMGWLGGSERPMNVLHPGRDATIELPDTAAADTQVRIEPGWPHREIVDGTRRLIHFDELTTIGDLRVLDAGTGRWLAGASVTIDPRESDLRAADGPAIAALETRRDSSGQPSPEAAGDFNALAGAGRLIEFWPWLLLAAALSAIAEGCITLLAARREGQA